MLRADLYKIQFVTTESARTATLFVSCGIGIMRVTNLAPGLQFVCGGPDQLFTSKMNGKGKLEADENLWGFDSNPI